MSEDLRSKLILDLMAELLRRGTSVRFRPSGRSMYPSIREGELVTVEPVGPSHVKREDIILYRSRRGLIAHRVVEVSRSSGSGKDARVFRLRGDASLCCDQPVAGQQVLGRVVGVQRNGRSIPLASRGAKLWHRARRRASGLRGALRRRLSAVSSQEEQLLRVFAPESLTENEARVRSKAEVPMEKM